ncbi:MAG: pectinesterase family protein, partial [Eubacteriales bacterium]
MLTVSQDGRGGFSSIQAAIDAIPDGPRDTAEIYIREGVYYGRVVVNKPNLRIVGESAERVAITHSA